MGKKKREHITPILVHLHWLPVKFRIEYKVLTFVFKACHGLAPVYISDFICAYSPRRSLRSSSENLLTVPLSRLKSKGDRAFSVLAPKLWNSLPQSVRLSSSLSGFKSSLKTYLFSQAYSWLLDMLVLVSKFLIPVFIWFYVVNLILIPCIFYHCIMLL